MDSERMKIPKTNSLLKFKKAKKSISLDSRFVDTRFPATVIRTEELYDSDEWEED